MKKFSMALLALAAALAITPMALADPITGSIGIAGYSDSWNGTSVTFHTNVATAGDATGDFATTIPGAISPSTVSATIDVGSITFTSPDVLAWTATDGTNTATFTITGPVVVVYDSAMFLNISGTGIVTLSGYDATAAYFSFTSTVSGASTNYLFDVNTQPPTPPAIPEPGTLSLFGTGLLGLAGMLRRKFAKS